MALPTDFAPPAGLHIGWSNLPIQVERRLFEQRLPAVQAFVRANRLDRVFLGGSSRRRLGIVTTGKAYLDVRQALDELGVDAAAAAEFGLEIYKVALSWPLEPEGIRAFARGLEHLIVIEEKRPVVEEQLARLLFNSAERPRLVGKLDADGMPCVPNVGELTPGDVVAVLRGWLSRAAPEIAPRLRPPAPPPTLPAPGGPLRLPAFCSGCPHNTSTVVPEGSLAQGGIGCHGMAVWLPDRPTLAVTHMGGEGANWIGSAPYTDTGHIFQNLGDGTYFHSGLLAIRAAVAAGVHITYKILANGAVAMTGGQPIEGERMEGEITVPEIARQLAAEGVRRIAIASNEPEKYSERRVCAGRHGPPPRPARPRAARAARRARRVGADLRPDLRRRGAPAAQARRVPGSRPARRDQRARLRGLRRLQRAIELHLDRADRDRVRAQAPDQPVELQQGLLVPARATARASSRSKAAGCAQAESEAVAGDDCALHRTARARAARPRAAVERARHGDRRLRRDHGRRAARHGRAPRGQGRARCST